MRLTVRYDVARDFGGQKPETRREYNQRFSRDAGPEVKIPKRGMYLWEWFWTLCRRRGGNRDPLTYSEIDAWSRLTGETVDPAEVKAIMRLDDAFLAAMRQGDADEAARKTATAPAAKRK